MTKKKNSPPKSLEDEVRSQGENQENHWMNLLSKGHFRMKLRADISARKSNRVLVPTHKGLVLPSAQYFALLEQCHVIKEAYMSGLPGAKPGVKRDQTIIFSDTKTEPTKKNIFRATKVRKQLTVETSNSSVSNQHQSDTPIPKNKKVYARDI